MNRIFYNFKNLSLSERDMIMQLIDIIEELRFERNNLYCFLEDERKRDMSNNTERFRCGYIACLNNLEEFLNKRNSDSREKMSNKLEEQIKSEAVKEFAKRLKCGVPQETGVIRCADVDNLVKEMVGGKNE